MEVMEGATPFGFVGACPILAATTHDTANHHLRLPLHFVGISDLYRAMTLYKVDIYFNC